MIQKIQKEAFMIATLTSKGQITIPTKIRKALHLKTGDSLDFVLSGEDSISLVPYRTPITKLKGIISKPKKLVSLAEMEQAIGRGGEA